MFTRFWRLTNRGKAAGLPSAIMTLGYSDACLSKMRAEEKSKNGGGLLAAGGYEATPLICELDR